MQGRLPVRERLKQDTFSHHLQSGSDGVVARIANVTRSVLIEFNLAQLKQADIRTGALLGVKAGLDFCNCLHERGIQPQYVGHPPDFFDWCSRQGTAESAENDVRWSRVRGQFRISVKSDPREILLCIAR